ncbi:hybrid sensor histidine kinase/response regulator [Bacteroides sp. 214]|uniref:hybrid sensor histidine kinase/response regulator transcription factor n=1 Tax=Bacteroides sp. 214 TaxID=2302935 RepID=UPI0013D33F32|nr:hybrid sensor histidine kinase/response regulator transcription factor [Bacteroides sp. 214]NDW12985.1 hybrid sensor histidine kinase/response regulator [Bacteroides sp. 214]
MKKIRLILLLICWTALPLFAIDGLRFESITNKEGLSHNTVRSIMQDSRGFMWFSTVNGLNRYDGHKFISMHPEFGVASLAENNIRQTIEGYNGLIWVQTTSRYFNCYDTKTESFVDYTGRNEARNYRKIHIAANGDTWLWGTEHGACHIRYEEEKGIPTLYDANTIGTNTVSFVIEDTTGETWIGTDKGLLQIANGIPKQSNIGNQLYNYHSAIEVENQLYFFTNDNIVLAFDKKRKVFTATIRLSERKTFNINHTFKLDNERILIAGKQGTLLLDVAANRVSSAKNLFGGEEIENSNINTDNTGNAWVYNRSGNIWRFRKELESFEKYRLIPQSILSLIDMERYDILCDSRGIAWITTFGNGLFTIENNGEVSHFTTGNSGLRTNYLLSVQEDRAGEIWIGTENTGISKISFAQYNNKVFLPNTQKNGYSDKIIRSIFENPESECLWIGTKSGDIYVFDKDLKRKFNISLKQGVAYCMTTDGEGNTWIGTKGDGLLVVPKGKKTPQESYNYHFADDNKIGTNNIYTILRDTKGRMWIGTFGGGLFLCELRNGVFNTTSFATVTEKQRQIRCIIQDSSGLIWVGGENGIITFEPEKLLANDREFKHYHFDRDNPHSLSNNIVKAIHEDARRNIWVGTSGGGLNLVTKEASTGEFSFIHYTSEEGLMSNMIQAILEDQNENIWLSTENGISKFNPADVLFENYNFLDSWESDLFCESAAYKRKNGELLFGSFNGMYILDPASFDTKTLVLPVTITELSINGAPVSPNTPDSPLNESITKTQSIRLRHGQNSFSLEFSSLNYQSSHSNRYTYILENYDKSWNPATQYNIATYKNIPAGKYLFKVKNVNNVHAWDNMETLLEIIVVPPFWKSWQALLLYIVVFLVAAFFIGRLLLKMNKLHNDVAVEKQFTEFRLRFFTNISHEFRTPLTIIRGSIESMSNYKPLPAPLKKHILTLEKSSSKLMRLIDQLLEFRKMQNDQMDLRVEQTEVVGFVKGIYEMFTETAERNRIEFTFASNEESRVVLLDKGKIEKVVFNLLSNAFKYTPEEGKIALNMAFEETNPYFTLTVSDSGIGIPPEKRELLFVRFKQINYSTAGMGIGLHLAAELTHIHKGDITYSDSEWGGACFIVSLPATGEEYDAADIVTNVKVAEERKIVINLDEHDTVEEVNEEKKEPSTKKYKILLIEDDEEIRIFLEDHLKDFFTIVTAVNGLKGWETAIEEQPSLIVCDVMMPEMDGFEATRKLKADFQTSHIPIILLTAHSSIEHQVEGINAGADAYIIKPFSTEYLISRIIKLIEQREKLQYKFAHEPGIIQTTICTTDKDSEFIAQINEVIEQHIDNAEFSIDDFAHAVNMGRTIFYKKIKGITNYSPNEYMRIIRLKKAADMLRTTDLTISEIAYKVGFNDPAYFSKCFKEQFGSKPTIFRNGEGQ